jgi:hypothetical protein
MAFVASKVPTAEYVFSRRRHGGDIHFEKTAFRADPEK